MQFTKQEICLMIVGKTTAEMQRIVKQYDFKFVITKYDNKLTDIKATKRNKQISVEIVDNLITKAE